METLSCENLALAYRDGERTTYALREVSLSLPPKNFYGIMGPSGSGKSSLLYLLSGLKRPTGGRVTLGTTPLSQLPDPDLMRLRRTRFGFVFQQPFLLTYLTALENIVIAAPKPDAAARQKAQELLESLGLATMAHKQPSQLSGGERQRVAIAGLLAQAPRLYLLDEPLAHLDLRHQLALMRLLRRRVETAPCAVVASVHDLSIAARCATHALVMSGTGCVAGTVDVVLSEATLSAAFEHPVRRLSDGETVALVGR